jgi:uncharacterized membrane protein
MPSITDAGALLMLIGVILMALPVIRVAPWGYTPVFEVGLAIFLLGLLVALVGAIGWIIGAAGVLTLVHYPLAGG